jgi:hypothetical protein
MIADLPTAHIPILRWSQSPHPVAVWSAVVKVEVSINGEPLMSAGKETGPPVHWGVRREGSSQIQIYERNSMTVSVESNFLLVKEGPIGPIQVVQIVSTQQTRSTWSQMDLLIIYLFHGNGSIDIAGLTVVVAAQDSAFQQQRRTLWFYFIILLFYFFRSTERSERREYLKKKREKVSERRNKSLSSPDDDPKKSSLVRLR